MEQIEVGVESRENSDLGGEDRKWWSNMSILDKRVSEDDIQRVNEIRHHPKYERGFEKECTEEKVWYMKDSGTGLPEGYYMFADVQEQFDRWQANKSRQNGVGIGQSSVGVGQSSVGESKTVESGVRASGAKASGASVSEANKEHQEKKESLFDRITNWLMKYAGIE